LGGTTAAFGAGLRLPLTATTVTGVAGFRAGNALLFECSSASNWIPAGPS